MATGDCACGKPLTLYADACVPCYRKSKHKKGPCSTCGVEAERLYSLGRCAPCYRKSQLEKRTTGECVRCRKERKLVSEGYCEPCRKSKLNGLRDMCPCPRKKIIFCDGKCRMCYRNYLCEKNPGYREELARKKKEYLANWKAANPDNMRKLRAREAEIRAAKRAEDTEEYKFQHMMRLYKTYGFEEKQVREMLAVGCELCGSFKKLVIDHNHTTGKGRGCLCHNCNIAISTLEKDQVWLNKAITYIQTKP